MTNSQKETKAAKYRKLKEDAKKKYKWVANFPRLKDAAKREAAHLKNAGLTKKSGDADPEDAAISWGRKLGGSDPRARHQGMLQLREYMFQRSSRHGFSELDLLMIHKASWNMLYMADQAPVQDALAKEIAGLVMALAGTDEEDEYAGRAYQELCQMDEEDQTSQSTGNDSDRSSFEEESADIEKSTTPIQDDGTEDDVDDEPLDEEAGENENDDTVLHCRGAHLAALFVRTYFRTLQREWGNMDKYRVDKFYTLSRYLIFQVYSYMKLRHWNYGIIRLFNDGILEEVLSQAPNGLRFHLIDVALEELAKANEDAPLPLTEATLLDCLEPFLILVQKSTDTYVRNRIVDKILRRFLLEYSVVGDNRDKTDAIVLEQVHVGTVAKFLFDVARDPETPDSHRAALYDVYKTYQKRLKRVGTDVSLEIDDDRDSDDGILRPAQIDDGDDDESEPPPMSAINDETMLDVSNEESQIEADDADTDGNTWSRDRTEMPSTSKKTAVEEGKKGKRKRKSKSDGPKMGQKVDSFTEEETTVTVSLSDQHEARLTQQDRMKNRKKKMKHSPDDKDPTSTGKRISFESSNQARSYKSSMKKLSQMDMSAATAAVPEKSILLNKNAKVAINKQETKKRKKSRGWQ